MTTTTLFSCQACHSKGAAAKKQRGNSSGSNSDSNVHFRQSKLRVLCVIPTVQPVPVQHHVAAAAQVASSFEFELVGILQRATHSLAPPCSSRWGHSASFHCLFIRCALSLPLPSPLLSHSSSCFSALFRFYFFRHILLGVCSFTRNCIHGMQAGLCRAARRQVGVAAT